MVANIRVNNNSNRGCFLCLIISEDFNPRQGSHDDCVMKAAHVTLDEEAERAVDPMLFLSTCFPQLFLSPKDTNLSQSYHQLGASFDTQAFKPESYLKDR